MYSLTDIVRIVDTARSHARTCIALVALSLGCGANDQVLGTVRADQNSIQADSSVNGDSGTACTSIFSQAKPLGADLALHLTIDRSSSMADPRGDKWDALASGLIRFLNSGATNGLSVGLEYFPAVGGDKCGSCQARDCGCLNNCGCPCDSHGDPRPCQRAMCDQNSYRRADIEIAPVSQNGGALAMSLFAQMPAGPTTLRPALQGALTYATAFQAQHPEDRVVELVVSGGPPAAECAPSGVNDCADVAAASSIRTNVVAFEYDGGPLAPVAGRGGGKLFQVDSRRDDVAMRFGDIVNELRGQMHCEYDVPSVPAADLAKVTLEITSPVADASPPMTNRLTPSRLKNRDACSSVSGLGWYYDRSDNPTRIVVCDNACKLIGAPDVTVSISVGCSAPITP